jgi:hypothetical protein
VTADLLTRLPTTKLRSFNAEISVDGSLKKGETVNVDKIGNALSVSRGHIELARCEDPQAELIEAVGANRGIAQGTVLEVHEIAGIVEIFICVDNPK